MCGTHQAIGINASVRVRHDVPQVGVRRGTVGVVQSRWFAPDEAYEIEFAVSAADQPVRVILYEDEIELMADPGEDAPLAWG
jgi:hypothetical protein